MPAKNSVKQYIEGGYYHIYNRGVEKRTIFLDDQDYAVFLSYLKQYLLPKDERKLLDRLSDPTISSKERDKVLKALRLNNFSDEITLVAYCLMPNHLHLLVKQKSAGSINKFMQSLSTRYTMYFNHKYKRVGPLCQDVYKAVVVGTDEQFLHLTRYIHKQALRLQEDSLEAQPSSYQDYLFRTESSWVHPEEVLLYFSKTNPSLSYRDFVEGKNDLELIYKLTLED